MLSRSQMEEQNLPSIQDMYSCTRQNHDYNVIRAYEGRHKHFGINTKPTKKDHYLDRVIRLDCSPGPASTYNFTQIQQTNSPHGPARTPSKANEQKNKPSSMIYTNKKRKEAVPLPITTPSPCLGPKKRINSKISVKKPTLQTLPNITQTRPLVQATTMSLIIQEGPGPRKNGKLISLSNLVKFQEQKQPPILLFPLSIILLQGNHFQNLQANLVWIVKGKWTREPRKIIHQVLPLTQQ